MKEHLEHQLIAYFQGQLTSGERDAVLQEVEDNDEAARLFYELMTIYQAPTSNKQWDHEAAFEQFKTAIAPDTPAIAPTAKVFRFKRILQIAAVLVPLVILLAVFSKETPTTWETVATVASEIKEVTLPDGSRVTINQSSSISYPTNFKERTVRLEGEALFAVEKDAAHPFEITTKESKVTVLGTEFNVKSQDSGIEVEVLEGKVRLEQLANAENFVILTQDEGGRYESANQQMAKYNTSASNSIAWKTKTLSYNGAPFHQVIKDLEELYQIDFEFADEGVKDCPFKVDFVDHTKEEMLQHIEFAFSAKIEFQNDQYTIYAEPCE